mgnify:CR=1 FL=1
MPTKKKKVIVVEQPVEPKKKKSVAVSLFEYVRTKVVMIGSIAAAIASCFTLMTHWDTLGLPRLAFYSEVKHLETRVNWQAVGFRQYVRDETADRMTRLLNQAETFRIQNKPIPDALNDQLSRLQRQLQDAEQHLTEARRRVNDAENRSDGTN